MRYTEYHAGIPVIRDRALLPEAVKKLAVLEDNLEEAAETLCDGYCKYPYVCPDQATLDRICGECKLKKLFEALS